MNGKLRLAMVVLVILSLSTVSYGKEIISKQLLDSQYGIVGDWLGFGDRFYKVTYDDGTSEELVVTGISFMKKAAITEYVSSGDVDSSQCYKALLQYRVKTVQDSARSYSLNHKIEVWRNDYNMNIGDALFREFPNWKVAYTPEFTVSETYPVLQTIQIPWEYGYSDYRMAFDVVEYQQKNDGTWVKLVPGIADTTRVNIKWWTTYQSGSGRGDLMSGCSGAPAQSTPPATSSTGTSISVSSSPAGATVSRSGQSIGTTPMTLALNSGESAILTFTKPGYVTQYQGVSSSSGSSVSVVLLPVVTAPIPTPTPTPAPATTTVVAPAVTTPSPATTTPGQSSTTPAPGLTLPPVSRTDSSNKETNYLLIAFIVIIIGGGAALLYKPKKNGKRKK